jgi:hypothetical protein
MAQPIVAKIGHALRVIGAKALRTIGDGLLPLRFSRNYSAENQSKDTGGDRGSSVISVIIAPPGGILPTNRTAAVAPILHLKQEGGWITAGFRECDFMRRSAEWRCSSA